MAWNKAQNEKWLAERLAELKQVQLGVAAKRGAAVAAACDLSGKVNFAQLRDLYVRPNYSDRIVYVDSQGGKAVIGCRDRRRPDYVAGVESCARHLRELGFNVRVVSAAHDPTSYWVT